MDSKDQKTNLKTPAKPTQQGVAKPVRPAGVKSSSVSNTKPTTTGKASVTRTGNMGRSTMSAGSQKSLAQTNSQLTKAANAPKTTSAPKTAATPKATNVPKVTPMSSREKMEKSVRGLSFTGGGVGNNVPLSDGSKLSANKDDKSRRKVGGIVLDMETIQDANKQKLSGKGNRKKIVIIIVLSVLLLLSLAYLAFTLMTYFNSKKIPNLKYSVVSEVDANWLVEGQQSTQFIVRKGLKAGKIYKIDSKLHIESTLKVNIEITVKVTSKGSPVNVSLMGLGKNFVNKQGTSVYEYQGGLEGGGTIDVFNTIDFKNAPSYINSDNVEILISANITVAK